jgi:hypothetical protein
MLQVTVCPYSRKAVERHLEIFMCHCGQPETATNKDTVAIDNFIRPWIHYKKTKKEKKEKQSTRATAAYRRS